MSDQPVVTGRLGPILATMLLAVTTAWAQSGGLRVMVVDATDDAPIPGAIITLSSSVQLVPETSEIAGPDGMAVFPILRPGGGYIVEVIMPGFATRRIPDLRVKFNVTQTVMVGMTETLTETVEVTASSDVVDLEDVRGATKFSSEFIEDLPVLGRFYTNVLTLAPGVQDSDGDGNPNVHGARERDFQAIVGGVSNVDPLTGLRLTELNIDSIEEIEVITTGAGVEYGRAQGGFANVIEKQGTNRFEGLFNFIYRSSALDGDGATGVSGDRVPDFEWIQPAIHLSGPIVRDHLWFRLSHELIDRQDPIDTLGGVSTIDTRQVTSSDTITWQVSRRNRLTFGYLNSPIRIENMELDSTLPPESSSVFEFEGPTWRVGWTAPISPSLLVESLVAYQDAGQNILPTVTGGTNNCITGLDILERSRCLNTSTGQTSGPYPFTWRDKRQRLTVKTQIDYFSGRFWGADHRFKFGFAVENERYQRFLERRADLSLFIFAGLFDELGVLSGRFAVPPISDANATGSNVAIFVEDQMRPLPNLSITVGVRVDREEINSIGFEPMDPAGEAQRLFEQVNPLLMAGADEDDVGALVRSLLPTAFTAYENIDDFVAQLAGLLGIPETEAYQRLNSFSTQSASWDIRRRLENVNIINTNPAPFLGVSWDPFKTGKTKFAATVGRHYDKIFLAVPLIELEPVTTDLAFQARKRSGVWEIAEICNTGACFNPGVNTRVVDRDLNTPFQDEFALSFERELAPETAIKLAYVRREFKDQLQDVDLNHDSGDFGLCGLRNGLAVMLPSPGEGQTIFNPWTRESYVDSDPGIGDGLLDDCLGRLSSETGGVPPPGLPGVEFLEGPDGIADLYVQNPAWGGVFLVGNFNTAKYEAFVIELVRRQYRNWQMNGSYTWSKAEGDAEDFNQILGNDPTLVADERGYLSYDQRHVVKLNATTLVPWAGGFRFGTALQWQSGLPYSLMTQTPVLDAVAPYLSSVGIEPRVRLTYDKGQRNSERNEAWWNLDLHLAKEFNVTGGVAVQLTADVFNVLNDNSLRVIENLNGVNSAVRRFGRQFQIGLRVAF